jgi:hypothetical protein
LEISMAVMSDTGHLLTVRPVLLIASEGVAVVGESL